MKLLIKRGADVNDHDARPSISRSRQQMDRAGDDIRRQVLAAIGAEGPGADGDAAAGGGPGRA